MEQKRISAPGLKYRTRAGGAVVPIWCARPDAIKAGWTLKTVNLSETPIELLKDRCDRLQREMLSFLNKKDMKPGFDGSIRSVIDLYMEHEESSYHRLKPSSRHPYDSYLKRLRGQIGERNVTKVTGLDVIGWHKLWRAPAKPGGKELLGAASMAIAVLKSALNWAIVCGHKECMDLRNILGSEALGLPSPGSRTQAPTAAQIEKARAAAHALGRPSAALAYAIQFETAARQWDVIGEWVPLSHPLPSAVIASDKKWIGPSWGANVSKMVLTITPTKTNTTTKARTHVDLSLCPMVIEELARQPADVRSGPLIVNETTGVPYTTREFREFWAKVRAAAGLSSDLWNRDIRAGALTEGGEAAASSDDRRKLAGHADEKMTQEVYDRDILEGSNRVVVARVEFRARRAKNV